MVSTIAGKSSGLIAQGGHVNVKDIQPVKKVGAKVPLGHRVPGVAIGRRQNAHVDFLLLRAPSRRSFALPARAAASPAFRGHLAHFVQQQCAARGQFEAAGASLDCAVNAPSRGRRSRFRSGCRNGRTIHSHKWPRFARAQIVQRRATSSLPCRFRR